MMRRFCFPAIEWLCLFGCFIFLPLKITAAQTEMECSGTLRPMHDFTLYLMPGERVVSYHVEEGAWVEKGAPLVQLANDEWMNQKMLLEEKWLELQKDEDRHEMLRVRIEVVGDTIARLSKQIEEEQQVREKVPDYLIEGKIREWIETKKIKEGEMKILNQELSLLEKNEKDRKRFQTHLSEQIRFLQEQIDQLLIKASFPGRVMGLSPFYHRLMKGDKVLEIVDEKALQVEARIWQHQIKNIQPGCRAKIFPQYQDSRFIPAVLRSIDSIGRAPDENHFPCFQIILDLTEFHEDLKPGMVVTVQMEQKEA